MREIISRRIRWEVDVARMEEKRNACNILVIKPKGELDASGSGEGPVSEPY
jgi:hypothetical protein